MSHHGTASCHRVDGAYIEFQLAVLRALPRDIDPDIADGWCNNGQSLKRVLREALLPPDEPAAKPGPESEPHREFPTWKTVKIGVHKSVEELSKALTDGGFRTSDNAAEILNKTTLAETESEIELVKVSGTELGFEWVTQPDLIYERAKELGLELLPAEIGPQLRLEYQDQSMDEWMLVAMEPIVDKSGNFHVFSVGRNKDGQWLDTGCGNPGYHWHAGFAWLFARRKKN